MLIIHSINPVSKEAGRYIFKRSNQPAALIIVIASFAVRKSE